MYLTAGRRKSVLALLATAIILATSLRNAGAQGGSAVPAMQGKKAEEVFKNIQVLKGVPAEQVIPTMQFVATSLGVGCTFCHVQGANDKDDKETKQTARKMMQMVFALNKDYFNGRVVVTCYSCHRGNQDPVGTPVISDLAPAESRPAEVSNRGPSPDPAQLLDRYLQAIGGADAIAKVQTRVAKGTAVDATGERLPVEIYEKLPDRRVVLMKTAQWESSAGFDADSAWMPQGRATRDLSGQDAEGARLEDDLYLATHVKQLYTWRAGRPDKVQGRDAYVLNGAAPGHAPVRLYFDQQTGMLLRMMHFTENPFGRMPVQVDFSDYREVSGVKMPFQWTVARPNGRQSIELDQLQINAPVEDSKLARPAPAAQGGGRP